jgi:hypothetical protein
MMLDLDILRLYGGVPWYDILLDKTPYSLERR